MFVLGDNRPRTGLGANYLYNKVKKYIWNTRCKRLDETKPETVLSAVAFFRFLDFCVKDDRILLRRHPELQFIMALSARRGIG